MRELVKLTAENKGPVVFLTVELGGELKIIRGRDAWALNELISAGNRGVTPIERPAPRWSHYCWKLRRAGIHIETVDERHGGAFAGAHARYILRTPLRVVEVSRQHDAKSKRNDVASRFEENEHGDNSDDKPSLGASDDHNQGWAWLLGQNPNRDDCEEQNEDGDELDRACSAFNAGGDWAMNERSFTQRYHRALLDHARKHDINLPLLPTRRRPDERRRQPPQNLRLCSPTHRGDARRGRRA
jgi:hypothetical protein